MRLNRSLVLGFVALAGLALVAGLEGARRRPTSAADLRATTFGADPNGVKALAETLDRLGVQVTRLRRHQVTFGPAESAASGLVVILDPWARPTAAQVVDFTEVPASGVSLMIAGPRSRPLMRCFGYTTRRLADSAQLAIWDGHGARPWVNHRLAATGDTVVVDSIGGFGAEVTECRVPRVRAVDTLLSLEDGGAVAVRLRPETGEATVTLISDVDLFRNRVLRDTDIGPAVVGWIVGRHDRVWFPEYLQGHGAGGSLVRWTLDWSRQSPWGWLAWHLAAVGVLILGFAAVRFGPPIPTIERRRRSVTEHVSAVARALRAAGGHRPAIGLLVDGLRRRLSLGGKVRGPWQSWIDALVGGATDPKIIELSRRLRQLDREGASEREVLSAANLVEDLWSRMRS